jgi:hypothetical protein
MNKNNKKIRLKMKIDFNKEFKDFLNNSSVYKNVQKFIRNDPTYCEVSPLLQKKFDICTKATIECLLINHDKMNNIHYARTELPELITGNNSQEVRDYFKTPNTTAQYIRPLVYSYFTEKNKELTNLRQELYAVIPNQNLVIDFKSNYKDFLKNSITYQKIVDNMKIMPSIQQFGISKEKPNPLEIVQGVMEAIILNMGVHTTKSFINSNLVNMITVYNSPEVKELKKFKDDKIFHLESKFIKSLLLIELTKEDGNGKEYEKLLKEEIEKYNSELSNKKSVKKKI